MLERTVYTVGAVVTDAVSKGADKQNVIKLTRGRTIVGHELAKPIGQSAGTRRDAVGACIHFSAHSLGLERAKKLIMFCFNDRCRVA